MSLEIVKNEIIRFISSEVPEVMVIKGLWGTGKTYAWNDIVKNNNSSIKMPDYSYVSLFGLQTLTDLKQEIFQNKISKEKIGNDVTINDYVSSLDALWSTGKKWGGILKSIDKGKAEAIYNAFYLNLNSTLICIDDLERKGKNLEIRDLLGLVSQLKEQKKCKIVLIFNEDAFTEKDAQDYKELLEKTIDTELAFSPTSIESLETSLKYDDKRSRYLKEFLLKFNVKNIRVIKKIERLAIQLESYLSKFDEPVIRQGFHTLVLMGWSYFSRTGNEIDFNFLKNDPHSHWKEDKKETEESKKHKEWFSWLRDYGFTHCDDFDKQIAFAIENGFFKKETLLEQAEILSKHYKKSKFKNSFFEAWDLYHDSYQNNEEEVIKRLFDEYKENFEIISLSNLNSLIGFFRKLGEDEKANDLIKFGVTNREAPREYFRLSNHHSIETLDINLKEAFIEKFESLIPNLDLKETFLEIAKNGWDKEKMEFLNICKTKDFYNLFKKEQGKEFRDIIKGCKIVYETPFDENEYPNVRKNIIKALTKISKESKMNELRVKGQISLK